MKVLYILNVIFILAVCNGDTNSRIGGGSAADIASYPFSSALLRQQGATYRHQCGGAIISKNAILTAASCFFTGAIADEAITWRARVGSAHSNSLGLVHIIRLITSHPQYQQTTKVNDVAVVRVSFEFVSSDTVQSAYLPGRAYSLSAGQAVQAIGWGATTTNGALSPQLLHTTIWVTEQTTCASRYDALNFTVTDDMLCAGWLGVGIRGQCQGDTGSPLVQDNVVVGVFSWSEGCADSRYPGINTKVSSYTRWIESTAVA